MDKLPAIKVVYDRKKQATQDKPALIYIEISHKRVRRYISTGISVYPSQWADGSCSIKKHSNAIKLNLFLEGFRREILDRMVDACNHPLGFDINDFVASFKRDQKEVHISFIDFMYKRVELRPLKDSTKRQHLVAIRALEESKIIVSFRDLTPDRLARFTDFLRNAKGLRSAETIYSYHRRISCYVSEAIMFGYIKQNPYSRYKADRGKSAKVKYLNRQELHLIVSAELTDEVLSRIRDLFVFQIYTGLSYSDLYAADYKSAELRDGRYYIRDSRVKTSEEYYLMLLGPALKVLKKYGWELPKYSNQKYNAYLKALALACGLKRTLTSHMARHTFATTITLSNDVPIQIVSKMLGHSDIKTTQRYAKVLADDVARSFVELDKKI